MLVLENVSRVVPGRVLFERVHLVIHPGDRLGLVGPNGSGKTSLLRVIAGLDEPTDGRVIRRPGLRVAYLPQEIETEADAATPLLEVALAGAEDVRELGRELARLEEELARLADDPGDGGRLERVSARYGELRALYEWFGGDALEARALQVLSGLGFAPGDARRPLGTFSGGWRMRALMARLLLSGADLLLLDEPTNHLDLDALAWLEGHLATSPAAILVVSHDRVFLDRVARKVADLVRGRLRVTPGGYTAWLEARRREREAVTKRDRQLAREEARLERFVARFGAKATKATQAKDKERLLERIREERAALAVDPAAEFRVRVPEPPRAPDPLLVLEGVAKRFGDREVFSGVDLVLRPGDRLAVLGPNGSGKTTLLRLLAGELRPDAGRRELSRGVVIGRFAQHQLETMDPEATVLEELARGAPGRKPEELRAALGALGLGAGHVERRVATLSGGERARLALARLFLHPANLLLLDEPTNHLDLPMREALEEALAAWPGTLVVVSHDRAFLARLARETLAVEGGRIERLDGGFAAYQAWRAGRREEGVRVRSAGGAVHERSREARRRRARELQERSRRLRPLRERVARLEEEIHRLEETLAAVDRDLADPAVHGDGERLASLARERERLAGELARLYPAWEEAAARLEEAEREN